MMRKGFIGRLGRKSIALFLAAAMLFSMSIGTVFAAEPAAYQDAAQHWAKEAIGEWSAYGVLQGDAGAFRPNDSITRAEMATIVSNLLGLKNTAANNFADVQSGAWYAGSIAKCAAAGILQGDNGNARPNDPITREEAAVILGRALHLQQSAGDVTNFQDSTKISDWSAGYVKTMAERSIVKGTDGCFLPNSNMTRAEVVTVLDNAVSKYLNQPGTYSGAMDGIVLVAAGGVVLDKATIKQDLLVVPAVAAGTVEIKDSEVKGEVTVTAADCQVTLDGSKTAMLSLESAKKLSLGAGAEVKELTVEQAASGVTIEVGKGAVVNNVVTDANKVTISGEGNVKTVTVNGSDTAINTKDTKVTLGDAAKTVTVNGKTVTGTDGKTEEKSAGGNGSSGGGGGVSTEVKTARADLAEQISTAQALQNGDGMLHDWNVLTDAVKAADAVKNSANLTTLNEALRNLRLAYNLPSMLQEGVAAADKLTAENFADPADFTALQIALQAVKNLTATVSQADAQAASDNLQTALQKATVEGEQEGNIPYMNNWEVNQNGINMVIKPLEGYHFTANISEYKDQIIDAIYFNHLIFDKTNQTYDKISYVEFASKVLFNLSQPAMWDSYVNDAQKYSGVVWDAEKKQVMDPVKNQPIAALMNGESPKLGADGQPLYFQYPGVEQEVRNALKAEGTVSLDSQGNLVIACDNKGYFKDFTNQIRVTSGGVPVSLCDLLFSVTVPAEAVEENVAMNIHNFFNIKEMKLHIEVWEYIEEAEALDGDGQLKPGVGAIAGKETNAASVTGPYDQTYYVQRVEGDQLTETDIRTPGTGGPNGTGNKLLKVCCDIRTGPAKWALDKPMTTFIGNFFRTAIDATGYGGKNDIIYTPEDDPEWLKIENTWLNDASYAGGSPANVIRNNSYYVNFSADSRFDVLNVASMWAFIEIPTVTDFDISEDMPIYCNLIGGMFGGSGQSVAINGQPATGHDGRYFFTITSTDDADLAENALLLDLETPLVDAGPLTEPKTEAQTEVDAEQLADAEKVREDEAAEDNQEQSLPQQTALDTPPLEEQPLATLAE